MRFEEEYMVRLCNPEDAATLAPLVQECQENQDANGERAAATLPDQATLMELIQALLTTGFSDFLLAEVKGKPVGCLQINYRLSTRVAARYAALDDFYVRPDTPLQSDIARSMLDYACQRANGLECAYIETEVYPEHTASLQLYERMGFDRLAALRLQSALPRRGRCHRHVDAEGEREG